MFGFLKRKAAPAPLPAPLSEVELFALKREKAAEIAAKAQSLRQQKEIDEEAMRRLNREVERLQFQTNTDILAVEKNNKKISEHLQYLDLLEETSLDLENRLNELL